MSSGSDGDVAVVVMGVSSCGKTAVGSGLAARIHARFCDADDLHPPENKAKMAAGIPLTDEDRKPWLSTCARELRQVKNSTVEDSSLETARTSGQVPTEAEKRSEVRVVLACSALSRAHRRDLIMPPVGESDLQQQAPLRLVIFVWLEVDREEAFRRASIRGHEFMPASLINSQFAAFEKPTDDEFSAYDPGAPTVARHVHVGPETIDLASSIDNLVEKIHLVIEMTRE